MIGAILRAQLLSLRRGGLGKNAGTFLAALPVFGFYLLWTFFAVGIFFLFSAMTGRASLVAALASALLGVFLYWQIAPVITVSMGASLDLKKLIIYPVDLDKLFLVEVLLRFFTVGEMLVILTGVELGIVLNPHFGGVSTFARLTPALLLFVVFNLLMAAGVRGLVERMFRRKGAREIGMLVFVLLCAAPGTIAANHAVFARVEPYLPVQANWPWGAPAQLGVGGPGWENIAALVALPVWIGFAYRFGRMQFYRTLRTDSYAGQQARKEPARKAWSDSWFRIPGLLWRDPLGALVEKELRSLSRCAGFRLAFLMGFTFGILLFFPQIYLAHNKESFLRDHFLTWTSVYSILLLGYYTCWNSFGYDRTASQIYFAAPVPFRQVLRAKNIAGISAQALELLLITCASAVLPLHLVPAAVLEAVTVTGTACLYLFALGNILSVRYPTALDPSKMSRGAGARSMNLLSMLVLPLAISPIALAYWGAYVFGSQAIFYALLALSAAIGAVVYWIATDSALDFVKGHQEQMITALSRGQGPLAMS